MGSPVQEWASAGEGVDLLSAWSQSHGVWQIPRKTVLRGQLISTLQAPWAQPSWTWLARAWRVCAVFDMKHQINTVNVLPRRIMVATLKEFFFCIQVSFSVEPGAILDKSQTGHARDLIVGSYVFLGKKATTMWLGVALERGCPLRRSQFYSVNNWKWIVCAIHPSRS